MLQKSFCGMGLKFSEAWARRGQSHDSVIYLLLNRQQAIERLFLVEEDVEEEEQKMRSRQAMAHWPCGFACTCRRVICPDVRNGPSERELRPSPRSAGAARHEPHADNLWLRFA
jgi:hypothetical protein